MEQCTLCMEGQLNGQGTGSTYGGPLQQVECCLIFRLRDPNTGTNHKPRCRKVQFTQRLEGQFKGQRAESPKNGLPQ